MPRAVSQEGAFQSLTRCQARASICSSIAVSGTSTTSAIEQRAREASARNEDSQWHAGAQRGALEKSHTA